MGRRNKAPDFLVKKKDSIFIVEHKHIKEGGGGQAHQMDELIEFISQSPGNKNLHYVSYLDGYYFNTIIKKEMGRIENPEQKEVKAQAQLRQIREFLKCHKSNYFVNTAGLKELLQY